MVKTLQQAFEKWKQNTSDRGDVWKANVTGREAAYCNNFTQFLGHTPKKGECEHFVNGINRVSAADFNNAISAAGNKYLIGLENA